MPRPAITLERLRAETIGADDVVRTPFGKRRLVYADFTASGRQLRFVEEYLQEIARLYANSHTEDSLTGRTATHLLHNAEAAIKRCVNAGADGKVVCCGAGSTASIHKLQQILGVAIPPATLAFLRGILGEDVKGRIRKQYPVVFVGPYEHHSNEITWREGLAEVVEVRLTADGHLDLGHLESFLKEERFQGRTRIGSFSAASNVTGIKSSVREITRLLHRHGALALFDYAAGGPYLEIDMCPEGDPEAALDAVFLSPHKFLGGPGASGVLVFNSRLYPQHLPPTVGGGGTVVYVSPNRHNFNSDIEAREKAGTPGFYQTLRAALALEVKEAIGVDTIQKREHELLSRALSRWLDHENIDVLGPHDPERRIGIVSFCLRAPGGQYLHPRFVTTLLDDLFGIQSRAGCSCAGPYGHMLLGIDSETELRYEKMAIQGCHGIKPGWSRVGFHFTMDDLAADYIIRAVEFVADHGHRFLKHYTFDPMSGVWTHEERTSAASSFSLEAALSAQPIAVEEATREEREQDYNRALEEAMLLAETLDEPDLSARLEGELGELQSFVLAG